MSRSQSGKLHWASVRGTDSYRAWATELHPTDTMVPYYLISKIATNQAVRKITLRRPMSGKGDVEIDLADNLVRAKAKAQAHYETEKTNV